MREPLWKPDAMRVRESEVFRFCKYLSGRGIPSLVNGAALRDWSLQNPGEFWSSLWDFYGIIGTKGPGPFIVGKDMPGTRFFPNARLNFTENLLTMGGARDPAGTAMIFWGEDKGGSQWTWGELRDHVSRLQQALARVGIGPGDRVAALLPNMPEAVAAMLATVSLGAVWCSVSPDFGVRAVLDRFQRLAPKALFAVDGYWYGGKRIDVAANLAAITSKLPVSRRTIIVDYLGEARSAADNLHNGVTYNAFQSGETARMPTFERVPFDHPVYIMFSSGTTGAPKCIVHRSGGVLVQHLKEIALHADIKPGDRVFYYTTLGWMMWNWLVSSLMRGAALMLYDGSPFHPSPGTLFRYAEEERFTHFGTSAKYIDSLRKTGLRPKSMHDLGALRAILSTGSPLLPIGFEYVYRAIKSDLHLASISGGTDIVSCFVCGDPTAPVYSGEIQGAGFGIAAAVWTEEGRPAKTGEKGELVCTQPFPPMPLGFWGDDGGERYRETYFGKFPNVWCQGDFAERTEAGGFIIHGRSDATLNPGGVRIGTAEIYAEVEKFDEILDAVVIGRRDAAGDEKVLLFVVMAGEHELADELKRRIASAVRAGSSPRHVPAEFHAVPDIPRTKNGKVSEIAVRDVVHGRPVRNTDALANPGALDCFQAFVVGS